ncbi:MAG: RagB/SusD family nutrient uptake outer membrane protein [Bacteroidales bacterium]|nr:RagB/SusD family nutrient uptake outer membrane protein [Bacteroidales bacterium]
MKNIVKYLLVALVAVVLNACSKEFIQKDRPYTMTESVIFSDADYIESALLGCYDVFKSSNPSFMSGLAYVVFDVRGDDVVNVSNPVTMQETYEMTVLGTSLENGRIWNYAYSTINTCNIFIENLEKYNCAEVIGEAKVAQYAAEAKFLRAYSLYVLANLYSQPYSINPNAKAVPLRTTALLSSGNNNCPAATISAVYQQILDDCTPGVLANAPGTYNGVTRASAAAAHMLRMRVYMAMSDWDKAITEGNAITGYSLAQDVTDLYGEDTYNNKEMIFALPMSTQDKPNTQMSAAEYFSKDATVSWLDTEAGILSNADYSLAADQRISKLISAPDGSGYVYSLKFVDKAQKLDWIPIFRYAETKLNLAECYANKADGATNAKKNLKDVRSRSIAAADDSIDVDGLTGGNLTTAIYNERRLEFICEGLRGIDIIRRGETFSKHNSLVDVEVAPTSNYYTWPIPDSEKNYNKTLYE